MCQIHAFFFPYVQLISMMQVDARDTANFDSEFTSEAPTDSYVEGPVLSQTLQQQFEGWSYNRPVAGLGDAGGSVRDPSFGSIPE
jgi:serum/glucocorticoid-regulated kinase 2